MPTRPLIVLAVLTLGFIFFTEAVTTGLLTSADREVSHLLAYAWSPRLAPIGLVIAGLGGVELTVALAVGLAIFLVRRGFRHEALALLALPLVEVLELVYKLVLLHPPPFGTAHQDAPSLTMLLERGPNALRNSYPSGHTLRAVLVYGLIAFVIYRLAPSGLARKLAIPAAVVIISLVALDRLYLGVHWTSDVIGGLLLGGMALAAAIVWLDKPRPVG
jgi:membrane-associated phospholipid phosphatase